MNLFLALDAFVALIAFCFNLSYFLFHSNGKKWLRLTTAVVMLYFFTIHTLALLGILSPETYGIVYIRPWLPVLYFVSMWDIQVDWRKKAEPPKKSRRRQ